MNALEHQLHYPHGDALPERGGTLAVAPGVKWLRMGLPFALDHINLWLVRDRAEASAPGQPPREGWAIVDCGIDGEGTREAWEQVFAEHLEGLPVLRVIVTHMHPDHIGLAHWLTARWQCPLWISATDYHAARLASQSTTGFGGEAAAAHFARHGLADPQALQRVRQRSNYYASMVPEVPAQYHRLLDGHDVRIGDHVWQCIAGYGHAPEHIALHCPALGLLISGDMVLPRISTNVSVIDLEPEANPLQLYLDSLQRYLPLPADTLVLPSHGKPFVGLATRVRQLIEHHDERFAEVIDLCKRQPTTAAELLPVLFKRKLDLHQTTFAMGEAIAHLHALWFAGRLRREAAADDGVLRFSAA
jgi:glyoxylase-like metal-dependent hydrolase (beta-lactamase superfamily II)